MESPRSPSRLFPVVGIGASAGGLASFQELLNHLDANTGMAFVLVSHMDPHHPSLLSEILSRRTSMPITEVSADDTAIAPNHVYVIRPGTWLTIEDGRLKTVQKKDLRRKAECIDHFLHSLAESRDSQAIAIVLSGTAADGSEGVRAVKNAGGITFAQDASAQFPDMPRNAQATGCVDFVLPPREIARELGRIARNPEFRRPAPPDSPAADEDALHDPSYKKILRLLRGTMGIDFTQYKQSTIRRRVARRMTLGRMDDVPSYLAHLEDHPGEVKALHDDILINVTSFFREPDSFDVLKSAVFPELLKDRPPQDPIRLWVPGCATGEEVYSIAMVLLEFLEERRIGTDIQIFGTDVSERAIELARAGAYAAAIESDVTVDRRRRFFSRTAGGGYQISKSIRDLCVFARQDVTRDPPFSRLDLLSCRNVLIYLGAALQKRVFPLFHYALKPKGYLILGSSESVGSFAHLFTVVDKAQRIFIKVPGATASHLELPAPIRVPTAPRVEEEEDAPDVGFDTAREADRVLLAEVVTPAIAIDENGQILHSRGDAGPYVRLPSGKPSADLLKVVREDLLVDLDGAIREAKEKGIRIRREKVRLRSEGRTREVDIDVRPLRSAAGRQFLVLFRSGPEAPEPARGGAPPPVAATQGKEDAARLSQELAAMKDYHRSIVERFEVANEKLRVAHEEILSSNEELQSTNEEMETAKEELQSANEELSTLNDELAHRNTELGSLSSDLQNLLSGIQIPVAIIDTQFRLRRFTPAAERVFNILPGDVNRRITDFKTSLELPDLEKILVEVIDTLVPAEREVRDADGRWYTLRVRPYRTSENRIEGVLMILTDVDALKRATAQIETNRALLDGVVETVRDALMVLDGDLRVRMANGAFYRTFGTSPEKTEGRPLSELDHGRWDVGALTNSLREILPKGTSLKDFAVDMELPGAGPRVMLLHARRISPSASSEPLILLAAEDATDRARHEQDMRTLTDTLEERVKGRTSDLEASLRELDSFSYTVSHDLRAPLRAMNSYCHLLREDYAGKVLDAEGEKYLARISDAASRMDSLIQNLLTFSRLGRADLPPERVKLDPLLTEVLATLSEAILEKKAQVTVDEPLGQVKAYRPMLVQVVENLVSNAVKFVPKGTAPRVRVRSERRAGALRLWVEDNGIGIAPEHVKRLFGVFERLNREEEYPGTGIGLAIVRRAVEKMGGQVGVESEPGKGSRFYVELPRDEGP